MYDSVVRSSFKIQQILLKLFVNSWNPHKHIVVEDKGLITKDA